MGSLCSKKKKKNAQDASALDENGAMIEDIEKVKEALSQGFNEFAVNLYQTIATAESQNGNIVISPFSIALAISLVERGADGDTRDQLRRPFGKVVAKRADQPSLLVSLRNHVLQSVVYDGQMRLANGLFCGRGYALKQQFTETARKWYDAQFRKLRFGDEQDRSRDQINQWASNATAEKIVDIIDWVYPDTLSVLANVITFGIEWAEKFDRRSSRRYPFYGNGMKEKEVMYMLQYDAYYDYFKTKELQLVELPYAGGSLVMYVILPKKRNGVGDIERIKPAELIAMFRNTKRRQMNLKIPRFTMRSTIDVQEHLQQFGVHEWKNMGRMSDGPLSISRVLHASYIRVNESGTDQPDTGRSRKHPRTFCADHPFIFVVFHKPTSTIVFMGKVNAPEQ